MGMGMSQFFPSEYGYSFVCLLGTLPTAITSYGTDLTPKKEVPRQKHKATL
jgi:hypothetical protein